MTHPRKAFSIWGIILLFSSFFIPALKGAQPVDILEDLAAIVIESSDSLNNSEPREMLVPEVMAEIVSEYYSEALIEEAGIDDSDVEDVLAYIAGVYSEHGYSETGNWAPPSRVRYLRSPYLRGHVTRYVSSDLQLPAYELSDFRLPVDENRITSSYGYRKSFRRFHHGVDLRLNTGDTVRNVLPGVVTVTGVDPGGYGYYVVVTHANNLETLYAHLERYLVVPGQSVYGGQPLGLGGETGNATGPHLHFETRKQGKSFDPSYLINKSVEKKVARKEN